jgi:hypothetical protein
MNNDALSRRIAAISAVIAALLILTATIVLALAVDFDFDFLANPADLITAGLDAEAAGLFHWGSILELLGSFLLLIPPALYLWQWLRPQNPGLINMATAFGLGSIFIGVIGAAIRASFWPPMMIAYPEAGEAQRQVLEAVFRSVTEFTFEGLYGVDSLLAGLWWLGIGLVLRFERPVLGVATAIMGAAILGAGVGWLFRVDPLARLELFYFFEPFWAIWLGTVIWQGAEKGEQRATAAAAV